MSTPIAPITTCKHCNMRFDGGLEIIGRPNARMEALLMKLGSHMHKAHPQHAQALNLHGAAFMGMLFLMNFKSTDAELNKQRDQARWQIHQQTLNARFSDESLWEQCTALTQRLGDAFDETVSNDEARTIINDMLFEVVKSIRDALEEPNRYPEAKAEQLVS
jgi:hypothetical protein